MNQTPTGKVNFATTLSSKLDYYIIDSCLRRNDRHIWIPACAGMTEEIVISEVAPNVVIPEVSNRESIFTAVEQARLLHKE